MGCSSFSMSFLSGCVYHTREQPVSYYLAYIRDAENESVPKLINGFSLDLNRFSCSGTVGEVDPQHTLKGDIHDELFSLFVKGGNLLGPG